MKMSEPEELLTVVDDNDNVIGEATKKEIRTKVLNHRSVHIFIFNGNGELMICKRPHFKQAYPNQYTSSAGGKVSAGENYEESAHRELEEELGIDVELKKIGSYINYHEVANNRVFHQLFMGESEGPYVPDPNEIEQYEFVKLDELEQRVKNKKNDFAEPFIKALKLYQSRND
jgi:isopentenyl-diphosphate delta-isomerase type 1